MKNNQNILLIAFTLVVIVAGILVSGMGASTSPVNATSQNSNKIRCVDFDTNDKYPDGKNYFTASYAQFGRKIFDDKCENSTVLREMYCKEKTSTPKSEKAICENGCLGGKCLLPKPISISAGTGHTCAVLSDGILKCWGGNYNGELGDNTTTERHTPTQVIYGDGTQLRDAVKVATGFATTCAIISDGTLKCWGRNNYGQLGNGTTINSYTPISVSGITNAIDVAIGDEHACALLSDGSIKCWGNNWGMLGDGTTTRRLTPVSVLNISTAVDVTVGDEHTCAVLSDGSIKCWGANYHGDLGIGTADNNPHVLPESVLGITNAVAVAGIEGMFASHTCALLSNGSIKCWGRNHGGQLGDGTTTPDSCQWRPSGNSSCWKSTPVTVFGIDNAVSISVGGDDGWTSHSCALTDNGQVKCWGHNNHGQLMDGTTNKSALPITTPGLNTAIQVEAGYAHTCILLSGGEVKCSGWNYNGELGDNTTIERHIPVTVLF